MSSDVSVSRLLAHLQAQIELHRERQAFHAQQTVFHEEQQAFHAAELEKVSRQFEAFRVSAEAVLALAPPAAEPQEDVDLRHARISHLIVQAIHRLPPDQRFGAAEISRQLNERYRGKLRRQIDRRAVGVTLRRLEQRGILRMIREGRPHLEALYVRARSSPDPSADGS